MKDIIKVPSDITKESIKTEAQGIIEAVNNGDIEPMRAHLQIRFYEDMIKVIKAGIKDAVLDDAEKYVNDDSFPAKVSIVHSGDRPDYEFDTEYSDIKKALKKREEKLKASFKNGAPVIDADTGELVPLCPVKKESELMVKVEFKK